VDFKLHHYPNNQAEYRFKETAFMVTNRLTFDFSLYAMKIDRLLFVWILAFGTCSSLKTSPL